MNILNFCKKKIDNVKKYVESVDWNERIQEWT